MTRLSDIVPTRTTVVLLVLLLVEAAVVFLLRYLGWYGTGDALRLATCLMVAALPLLVAMAMLFRRRLRFSLRAMFTATTLVALFLVLSLVPLLRHRHERQASSQLLSANATINLGMDWEYLLKGSGLKPLPELPIAAPPSLPIWLSPFAVAAPPDSCVRSVWLDSDEQCRVLAENWERLPSLQVVSVAPGVSTDGLLLLQDVLPRLEHLECVQTNDVVVPPNWYGSLTNVRILWVWGENTFRGKPFARDHLQEIVSLPNLEMLMVLGYAFNDNDARAFATSNSVKLVMLRGTAVTTQGESELSKSGRMVFRD